MKKKLITALCAAAVLVGTLTGCVPGQIERVGNASSDGAGTDPVPPDLKMTITEVGNDAMPNDVAVLCVDGSAFLYVWTRIDRGGGPAISRFTEKDVTCTSKTEG